MLDGLSATPYPSGVRNVLVEISEAITPIVVWRKELRKDSGGIGEMRGGLGQTMEITSRDDAPFGIFASFERVLFPARGRDGGGAASLGFWPSVTQQGFSDDTCRGTPYRRDAGRRWFRRSQGAE